MAYEAPTIAEIGSIESLTLGNLTLNPERDTFQFFIWGRPFEFELPVGGS